MKLGRRLEEEGTEPQIEVGGRTVFRADFANKTSGEGEEHLGLPN